MLTEVILVDPQAQEKVARALEDSGTELEEAESAESDISRRGGKGRQLYSTPNADLQVKAQTATEKEDEEDEEPQPAKRRNSQITGKTPL
jgi:hypothetical protein